MRLVIIRRDSGAWSDLAWLAHCNPRGRPRGLRTEGAMIRLVLIAWGLLFFLVPSRPCK